VPWGKKTEIGTVVSDKMEKTVVVAVVRDKRHPLYKKRIRVTKRFKAHNENNEAKLGDIVRIVETRPLSKQKRWRVIEIIQRGEVAEVAPAEIGREIELARHEERVRLAEERHGADVEAAPETEPARAAGDAPAEAAEPETTEEAGDEEREA
jgi:small subunit ribosomal protein S17